MRSRDRDRETSGSTVLDVLPDAVGTGVVVGVLAGVDGRGRYLVDTGRAATPVPAVSIVDLTKDDVGSRVVIAYEEGDVDRPMILGRVREPRVPAGAEVTRDGERVIITAEREIELRCGKASIVLTRAGKVLIRGSYVLSRSRGANRVKGAVVDIN